MVGGAGVNTAILGTFSPTTSLISPNGDIVRVPFSQLSTAGNYLGQGRNLFLIKDAISRQTYTAGASTVGYVFGSSTAGTSDSVLLGA